MNTADVRGLTDAQAKARLLADGPNELPAQARFNWAKRLRAPFREPAYQLLLAAGAVYLALGDRLEGALLFAAAVLAVFISIAQDYRTERTLLRLRDLSSPRALVRRDGSERRIPAGELVVQDIVLLQEGDRAPADGRLIEAHGIAADESLLTGESVPVDKAAGDSAASAPGSASFILGGSVIVKGQGVMAVTATGARSELGRIGLAVAAFEFEPPRLTIQMRRLVRLFGLAAIGCSLLLLVAAGLRDGDWLAALLLGLALAIALVPEEIPLVTAAFTVVGALRIARAGVLARQSAAIETLGEMTVLCLDKTGTLTQNRMTVVEVWTAAGGARDAAVPDAAADAVLLAARRACATVTSDPMELAILRTGRGSAPAERPARTWAFDRSVMAMAQLYESAGGDLLAVKGAPESVIPWAAADSAGRDAALAAAMQMASRGMRVLAVAEGAPPPGDMPLGGAVIRLAGLVGLADPLRPEAPGLIAECAAAGVRVTMMTGDHPVTASAIARQAGIAGADRVVEGPALAAMTEDARIALCRSAAVFARVLPEQKLEIVRALKEAGEIVGMTGDGVNDAPALKAAHIGVAMGERGSDVAREAAALVLVHDDLASLVQAVGLGRRIGDNIRKALAYIFSVHVIIAGAALLPVLAGLPPLLLPLHVVLLEFVIDPVCAIVLEADRAEPDVMRRPPRRPGQALFGAGDIVSSLALGGIGFAGVIAAYWWASLAGSDDVARGTSFLTIMMMNAALILLTRAQRGKLSRIFGAGNRFLWPAILVIFGMGFAAVYVAPIAAVLDFGAPRLGIVALCSLGALGGMLAVEAVIRLVHSIAARST